MAHAGVEGDHHEWQASNIRPLTGAENQELQALIAERDERRRQQRYQEAVEFANTIATLSAAQGLSFQQIADNIGFNLEDLGEDLGLSLEDLLNYLSKIDPSASAIPDSITSNTDRLIATLEKLWGWNVDRGEPEVTIDGRRDTGRSTTRPARSMPADDSQPQRGDVLAGVEAWSRASVTATDRGAREVVESNRDVANEIRALGRDIREGFGNQPRSTRYERDSVRR